MLDHIESIWKLLDRPLWVVTASDGKQRGGLIATWITQSSLSPQTPQILAGIAPNHFTCQLIDASSKLGLHLLKQDQLHMVERFAIGSGRDRDKLDELSLDQEYSTPIMANCLAWMDCQVFARLDAGDRVFFWADVVAGQTLASGPPLRESDLGGLPEATLRQLAADRDADIGQQSPLARQWRATLPPSLRPRG